MKLLILLFALTGCALAQSKLTLLGMGGASGAVTSPIARNGSCSAATTSCTFSATATGSLKITYAYRSASTTAPTLPAGWTLVDTGATAATGTVGSYTVGCNVSSSSGDTGTGTWTNASDVEGVSYSGTEAVNTVSCATLAIGALASNNAKTSTTLNYAALTMQDVSGLSWVDGLAGNSAGGLCAPAGMTSVTTVGAGPAVIASDTNAGATSWPSTNCTVTSGTWMSDALEIFGITSSANVPAVLGTSTVSGGSNVHSDPTTYTSPTTAGNALVVFSVHTNYVSGVTTVTDSLGNTWRPCSGTGTGGFTDIPFGTNAWACNYVVNGIGGADTVTVQTSDCAVTTCTNVNGYYLEISNIALTAAGAFDVAPVTNLSATSGSGSNNMSGGTLTVAAPGDIIISSYDNNSGTCTVGTSPTRFAMLADTTVQCLEWATWGGAGSFTPKLTLSTSATGYSAMSWTLKHK